MTYTTVVTGHGGRGVEEKLALIEAMADRYSVDRSFQEMFLALVSKAPSGAADLLLEWERVVSSLPYRREPGEILRSPIQTLQHGGDCDDLTTLFLAGAKASALPCQAQAVENSDGDGFHVRALVGLPPLDPVVAVAFDPVYESEREWAMVDVPTEEVSSRMAKMFGSSRVRPIPGQAGPK